jgi:hypothetical protein
VSRGSSGGRKRAMDSEIWEYEMRVEHELISL